jgi:hypothetical protein
VERAKPRRFLILAAMALITAMASCLVASPVALATEYSTATTITASETQTRAAGAVDIAFQAIAGHAYQVDVVPLSHPPSGNYDEFMCQFRPDPFPPGQHYTSAEGAYVWQYYTSWWPMQVQYKATATGTLYIHMYACATYRITLTDIPHSYISGVARDMATGEPLSGMTVSLYLYPPDSGTAPTLTGDTTTTATDGSYQFQIDWPNQYLVQFTDPSGEREGEFWGGSPDWYGIWCWRFPGRIGVAPGMTYADMDGHLGKPWALQGTVVDGRTGAPLNAVNVTVIFLNNTWMYQWDYQPACTTDSSGRFLVSGLTAHGYCWVMLDDPSGAHPQQWADAAQASPEAFAYNSTPGAISTPTIVMHTDGSLDGSVSEATRGSVCSSASLQVWRQIDSTWEIAAKTTADDFGHYSFSRLSPGRYRVAAVDTQGLYPKGWHGGTSLDTAKDVFVADDATSTANIVLGTPPASPTPPPSTVSTPTPSYRLARPSAPSSVKKRRRFKVTGSLTPKPPAKEGTLVLCFFHAERGKWKLRRALSPITHRGSASMTYWARLSLASRGKWRVYAAFQPAKGSLAMSRYRAVRVR